MPDDVIFQKASIIELCLVPIEEVYDNNEKNLFEDITKQDSIILNLQRTCEASIDLGMHLVRIRGLGVPQESRGVFELLEKAGVLEKEPAHRIKQIFGFRHVAVRDSTGLNYE